MAKMIVAASAIEERNGNGFALMTGAFLNLGEPNVHWIIGAAKNTELMTARALAEGLIPIFADDPDNSQAHVMAEKIGFKQYFEEYLPRWIRESATLKKHAGAEWTEHYIHGLLAKVSFGLPESKEEKRLARKVREVARCARKVARDQFYGRLNDITDVAVLITDATLGAPSVACTAVQYAK